MLADAYDAGQRNKEQVKDDLDTGRERAERQARANDPRGGSPAGGFEPPR